MIRYQVQDGVARIEFVTIEEADAYRVARGIAEPATEVSRPEPVTPPSLQDLVRRAREYGQMIADEFAAENIAMGITQAGKTRLIANAVKDISFFLSTGSIYEAANACDEVVITEDMAPFLTPTRAAAFKGKILGFFNT
jgi:hypothetical protein